MPPLKEEQDTGAILSQLTQVRPGSVWLGAVMQRQGTDRRQLARPMRIAAAAGGPLIASHYALSATPGQRPPHYVVTRIREGVTVATPGRPSGAHAQRFFTLSQKITAPIR